MVSRGWSALVLALGLVGCSGDPDLPRSYQHSANQTREARPAPKPAPPPALRDAEMPPTYGATSDGYAPPPYRPDLVPGAARASDPRRAANVRPPPQPVYEAPPPRPAPTAPVATRDPSRGWTPPPYRADLVPGPEGSPPARSPAAAAGERTYERPPVRSAASPPQDPSRGWTPPPYRPDLVPGQEQQAPPPPAAEPPHPAIHYADWRDEDYRYRIGAGDELALRFLLNPDLNGPVIVGPDGRGVFPLVSSVKVADLTVDQANSTLTSAYSQILRKPQVEVLITAYGSSQIFVGGEVRGPGVIPVKGQLTPAQAVMSAGGLLPTARTGHVVVLRQRADGQMLMKDIDLKAYLTKGKGDTGFAVLPGDLVFVPRSKIAEVDLFVEQYINGVLPFSRSVGYSINKGPRY